MSESAIRALLAAILGSVTDIGMVHDYERYTNTEAGMRSFFGTTIGGVTQVRGWQINRRSSSEQSKTTAGPSVYVMRGFLGMDDSAATEKVLSALVEAVRDKFRQDLTLHNAGYGHDPVQLIVQDKRSFGGFICEHAELNITVYDFFT